MIGFLTILINRLSNNTDEKNKLIGEKIGIGVISVLLLVQGILLFVFPKTDAYKSAKSFVENNEEIKQEIGDVMGITIKPYGGISMQTKNGVGSGTANLELIVKGSKKFIDLSLLVIKEPDTDWTVEGIE